MQRIECIDVVGDVSDIGYAGYSTVLPAPVIISLSQKESEQAMSRALSTVLRETINARKVIESVILHGKDHVKGRKVVYTGDNQGSIYCLNKMGGNPSVLLR